MRTFVYHIFVSQVFFILCLFSFTGVYWTLQHIRYVAIVVLFFINILYSILYFVVVFFSRRIVGNFIRQCFVRCCVCYINTAIGPISPIICLYAVGISLYVAVVAVLFAFSIALKNIFSVECKRLVSFIRYAQFFSLFLLSYAPEYYGDNFFFIKQLNMSTTLPVSGVIIVASNHVNLMVSSWSKKGLIPFEHLYMVSEWQYGYV